MAVLSPSPPLAIRRSTSGTASSGATSVMKRCRVDPAVRDQPVGRAEARGGVVERRGDRQLLVVHAQGVERDARVGRPAGEEVDEPSLAHRPDRGLRRLGHGRRPRSRRRAPGRRVPAAGGAWRRPRARWRRSLRRLPARAPWRAARHCGPRRSPAPRAGGRAPAASDRSRPLRSPRLSGRPRRCSARCRAVRRRAAPPWPPSGSRLPDRSARGSSPRSARGSARTPRRRRSRTRGRRRAPRGRPGTRGRRRTGPSWPRRRARPGARPRLPAPPPRRLQRSRGRRARGA